MNNFWTDKKDVDDMQKRLWQEVIAVEVARQQTLKQLRDMLDEAIPTATYDED